MFQNNGCRRIFLSLLSSEDEERKQDEEQRAEESYAVEKGAGGRQR